MNGKKFDQIFWGIFFVAAAVVLVLNQAGLFGIVGEFSLWTIFLTAILGVCGIKSLISWNSTGFIFCVAFLLIIYSDMIGLTGISAWTIIMAAVLLSIGVGMLLRGPKRRHDQKRYEQFHQRTPGSPYVGNNQNGNWQGGTYTDANQYAKNHEHFQTVDETVDDVVNFHTSFGSSVKYVNSGNFSRADLTCSFGAMKVYFDKAVIQNGTADIWMDVSFSGVELYVPRDWKVVNNLSVSIGGVDEKNRSESTGVPVLRLGGNVSFSGITIIYV